MQYPTNIEKMWGYIVKQSHDPFRIRNAADSLGLKLDDIKLNNIGEYDLFL